MHVQLIELLRCPNDHAESPLVAAATRTDDRHIVDGVLGCPECNAEYPVANGVARFGDAPPGAAGMPDADTAMRVAALLDLTDARGFALLTGVWCAQLDGIQRITEAPLVALNPPGSVDGMPAAVITGAAVAPFAAASLRAAALDAALPDALRASVVRSVRSGGRVLAPVSVPLPEGVRELGRDNTLWVGERGGPLVPLQRRG